MLHGYYGVTYSQHVADLVSTAKLFVEILILVLFNVVLLVVVLLLS